MDSGKNSRQVARSTHLRAIVDQFVERPAHPFSDIRQFEQLALGLMEHVENEEVAVIARPLCFHPETPASVFARLFEMGGACRALAFECAPGLPREKLLAIAQSLASGRRESHLVAGRGDLDSKIVNALIQRGEHETLRALAANRGAPLDAFARRTLIQAARDDLTLARHLLDRQESVFETQALFLAATRAERSSIILGACQRAIASGAMEFHRADPEFAARFERAAVKRDRADMAALLAETLECRKDRAAALLADPQGEPLALALAALGFSPDGATRIFLCAEETVAHDVDRVRALVLLVRSTPQRAALQIVVAMTGAAKSEREPANRLTLRDDALAAPGWRRAQPRGGAEAPQKIDQPA